MKILTYCFLLVFLLEIYACQNRLSLNTFAISTKDSIKNKVLERKINSFLIDSHKFSYGSTNTVQVFFYKCKVFWKIDFSNSDIMPDYQNLYGVIKLNQSNVIIFSPYDLSDFFYVEKPYDIDTLLYKKEINHNEIADYYFDEKYFDGDHFSDDSLLFNSNLHKLKLDIFAPKK